MRPNSFLADYSVIRRMMHLILQFGTLTPDEFEKEAISVSKYNKMKPILLTCIGNDIEDRRYQKGAARSLHITSDAFSEGFSRLCNTYMIKGIKPEELVLRILIMQILLNQPDLTRQELLSYITDLIPELSDLNDGTFYNQLSHLAEYGQVYTLSPKRPYKWSVPQNPFSGLSEAIQSKLTEYVSFMRQLQAPYVCGEHLYHSVCKSDGEQSIFLVRGHHIGHVLDDEVLYTLLNAINESRIISFDYLNQKQAYRHLQDILPVKVISMEQTGRRYLFAVNLFTPERFPMLLLLDRVFAIKTGDINTQFSDDEKRMLYQDALHFSSGSLHIQSECREKVYLTYEPEFEMLLVQMLPDAELYSENGVYYAAVKVAHHRELRPFLRQYAEYVRAVSDENHPLYQEMKDEARQWRKMYGIES